MHINLYAKLLRKGTIMTVESKVLVVTKDPLISNYLGAFISNFGHKVFFAASEEEALQITRSRAPDLVIIDLVTHGDKWLDTFNKLKVLKDKDTLLLLTDHREIKSIGDELGLGTDAFIRKPINYEELRIKISKALRQDLTSIQPQKYSNYHPQLLLGVSKKMEEVRTFIDHVARTDITVLIRGESGTGKELVARSLYNCSLRTDKPFIKVLCAAIPEGLLESELFGYEKGSFTGAHRKKPGKFEFANHGTIFLDEIGDISLPIQSKLLQVLQDGEFSRLGGNEVRVDVRIIAATNKNLEEAVEKGHFREDLYYRLNVVNIFLPSLRERKEDIPLLTEIFLQKYNTEYNKRYPKISEETLEVFNSYDWQGNVRELENIIKRIVIIGDEKKVLNTFMAEREKVRNNKNNINAMFTNRQESEEYPPNPSEKWGTRDSLKHYGKEAAKKAEAEMIKKVLQQTHWNRRKAAQILKISYKTLLYKMKECNIGD